jgi:hypothetical protein
MAQPEFTKKKCCYSWWLLGMIPFSINQFQTHRHSMKTLPEFISKSRKIRQKSKNVHFFEQKTKNAIPRGPLKGPSMFWAQPTPGRSQPSDPGEVLSSAVPLA